eukprot:1954802-Ditylum_brightwellii.AAC.1
MRVGLVAAKAMDYIIETVGVLPKSGLLTCALQDKGCRLRLMSTIRCPCKDVADLVGKSNELPEHNNDYYQSQGHTLHY